MDDQLAFVGFLGRVNKTQSSFLGFLEFDKDINSAELRFNLPCNRFVCFGASNRMAFDAGNRK
jgi:hypothetical protein